MEALLQQQFTLAGLSAAAIRDILGAIFLDRDDDTLDIIDAPVNATETFVYEVLLTRCQWPPHLGWCCSCASLSVLGPDTATMVPVAANRVLLQRRAGAPQGLYML